MPNMPNNNLYPDVGISLVLCGYGEMADALDSGSSGSNSMQVRSLLSAPK